MMQGALAGIAWVDWLLLMVVATSALVGLWRGFLFEAASLVGWLVAYFAARHWSPTLAVWAQRERHLPESWGTGPAEVMAFAGVFLVVLLGWALLARLLQKMVHSTPLAWPDRLGGVAFGILRALVILVALTTLVAWTPLRDHAAWQASVGRVWLERVVDGLKPFWTARRSS
jgi:membrane protein required for colicin V production